MRTNTEHIKKYTYELHARTKMEAASTRSVQWSSCELRPRRPAITQVIIAGNS